MYYNRSSTGRELFTRNTDGSSERWSQQIDGSQDLSSQIYGSQDSQRLTVPPCRPPPPLGSSQSSGSGYAVLGTTAAAGGGGRGVSQGPITPRQDLQDLSLARDIRFGLHTILSVMRDLPEQLKEVSSEVVRASQEPDVTRKLIKDTFDSLQFLVSGLEKKLSQLIHIKENEEALKQSLAQREDRITQLVNKVEELSSGDRQEQHDKLDAHFSSTRKDIRREMKKIRDVVGTINSVEPAVTSLQSHITKVEETLTAKMKELQTSLTHHTSPLHPRLDDFLTSTQQTSDQVQLSIHNMVEKMTTLPKDVGTQVCQMMRAMVHSGSLTAATGATTANSLFSPSYGAYSAHRPIFPLAESNYRNQVSPVAHVSPIAQVSSHVSMAPPATHPTNTHNSHRKLDRNTRPTPQPRLSAPARLDQNRTPRPKPNTTLQPNPSMPSHQYGGDTLQIISHPPHCDQMATPQPRLTIGGSDALRQTARETATAKKHKDMMMLQSSENIEENVICSEKIVECEEDHAGGKEEDPKGLCHAPPKLIRNGTQHFTPQKAYTLIKLNSKCQETLVLDCDSSTSSDGSPVLVSRKTPRLSALTTASSTYDWVEGSQECEEVPKMKQEKNRLPTSCHNHQQASVTVEKEIVASNVRKTNTIETPLRGEVVRGSGAVVHLVNGDDTGEIMHMESTFATSHRPVVNEELQPLSFFTPVRPVSVNKRKSFESIPRSQSGTGHVTPLIPSALRKSRARRYLTPYTNAKLELMILSSNKKV